MKFHITGDNIAKIRNLIGLTADQFAAVLAVHPGTVRRWEGAGPELLAIDGVAAEVLARLDREARGVDAGTMEQVGERVANALLMGSAVAGLFVLLKWLLDEE